MKKNIIVYLFIGIIMTFFLMYPIMYITIKKNLIATPFSNLIELQEEKGNITEKLSIKLDNIKKRINNSLTNYLFLYNPINQKYFNIKRKDIII